MAVNELKEKVKRAFYAIKSKILIDFPIWTWLKILDTVIGPIILYDSEVWGPLTSQDLPKWEKHPLETLPAKLCKNILRVHRHTANNACRAELGQYPIIIKIQKHLLSSDPDSFRYKALKCQEWNKDKSPLCQLILKLCPHKPGLQDRH